MTTNARKQCANKIHDVPQWFAFHTYDRVATFLMANIKVYYCGSI